MDSDPEFDLDSFFDPDLPMEVRAERAMLWAPVNLVFPLRLRPSPAPEGEADYLALKHQLLPQVPATGEYVEVPGYLARIDRVQWSATGKVICRLQQGTVPPEYLETLNAAGWQTFTRHDADDWFARSQEAPPGG